MTRGLDSTASKANWRQAAWALAQLYYDQSLKASARRSKRGNLAWPAWNIAHVAEVIGHRSALRHYSALALIGDIATEDPSYRGGAIHALTALWGRRPVERFEACVREDLKRWESQVPVYSEALLAAYWFRGRSATILGVAEASRGIPFVERLLDEAAAEDAKAKSSARDDRSGTFFEAAVALLMSATPGFEIRGPVRDVSSQTDIVAVSRNDGFTGTLLPEGHTLVECKFRKRAVSAAVVREFGARCWLAGAGLGILVARKGITGAQGAKAALRAAERERDRFAGRGIHILVLEAQALRGQAREMMCLRDLLVEDFERLRFGRPG
jgi:hypothetical protein